MWEQRVSTFERAGIGRVFCSSGIYNLICPLSTYHFETTLNRQVGLLIKRGADLKVKDTSGRDLLAIALEKADADIVTL